MSSCRCSEISSCNSKLQTLSDALSDLGSCEGQFSTIAQNLNSVASYSTQAYASNKSSALSGALKALHADMVSAKEAFAGKVSAKQTQLNAELLALTTEDDAYHLAQEQEENEGNEK